MRRTALWASAVATLSFTIPSSACESAITPDSVVHQLGEVEVKASVAPTVRATGHGNLSISSRAIATAGRTLGEADFINILRTRPEVYSRSDYSSGISLEGATPNQTVYRIAGAPIFFPYRFGGIFSTFNTSHFSRMTVEKSIHPASSPQRLGGVVDFHSFDRLPESVHANINIGLLSSSLTLRTPVAGQVAVGFSARISYIDQLYSRLLSKESQEIGYRFSDFNLTATYPTETAGTFSLDAYFGNDRMGYDDRSYDIDVTAGWKNRMAALSWSHSPNERVNYLSRLFYSSFSSDVKVSLTGLGISLPSSLQQIGLTGNFTLNTDTSSLTKISAGYEVSLYRFNVNTGFISGFGQQGATPPSSSVYQCSEQRIYSDISMRVSSLLRLDAGLSAGLWETGNMIFHAINPRISVSAECDNSSYAAQLAVFSQFFHQVGFSEIGMATDFFLPASANIPVSRAYGVTLSGTHELPWGIGLEESAYFRLISGEPDYSGQLLDIASSDYNPESHILSGHGFNTGFALTAHKSFSKILVESSYSLGIARRRFPGNDVWFRGVSEQGHAIHANLTFAPSSRWNLQANFIYTSGRPYTPVKAIYIIAGNIINEFGRHNSSRFPAYHRLDLSATYRTSSRIGPKTLSHLINFSLINAYGRRNVEMQSFELNPKTGVVKLHRRSSLYRFLPSISYTLIL